jgi:hypothetical protein
MMMIHRVSLKDHGKTVGPMITVFTPAHVISRSSTMVYPEASVSVHDRGSSYLSLTLIFVVPTSRRIAPERLDPELDDFAFIIPLDCKTSTPVASRKRKISPNPGAAAVNRSPHEIIVPRDKRRPLIEVDNCPWPHLEQDSIDGETSRVGKEGSLELGEVVYPPDPIFDFFGI